MEGKGDKRPIYIFRYNMAEKTELNNITSNGSKSLNATHGMQTQSTKASLTVQTSIARPAQGNTVPLGSPTVSTPILSSPPPGMSSPPGVGVNPIPSFGNPNDPVHDLPMELLQAGWRKFWSKREGRPYLFNKITNQSLWEMPPLRQVMFLWYLTPLINVSGDFYGGSKKSYLGKTKYNLKIFPENEK